jgi:hypothetical protein
MFGQDQQHLVSQPDSGIDFVENLAADRHVIRREPTAHSGLLQIGMDALSKFLVFGRITNEGRRVLDRLIEDGRQILNQSLWQTYAAKK